MTKVDYKKIWQANVELGQRLRECVKSGEWDAVRLEAEHLLRQPDPKYVVGLEELGLSSRACRRLRGEGFYYLGDLVQLTERHLYRLAGMGVISVEAIKQVLADRGLRLSTTLPYWPPFILDHPPKSSEE